MLPVEMIYDGTPDGRAAAVSWVNAWVPGTASDATGELMVNGVVMKPGTHLKFLTLGGKTALSYTEPAK